MLDIIIYESKNQGIAQAFGYECPLSRELREYQRRADDYEEFLKFVADFYGAFSVAGDEIQDYLEYERYMLSEGELQIYGDLDDTIALITCLDEPERAAFIATRGGQGGDDDDELWEHLNACDIDCADDDTRRAARLIDEDLGRVNQERFVRANESRLRQFVRRHSFDMPKAARQVRLLIDTFCRRVARRIVGALRAPRPLAIWRAPLRLLRRARAPRVTRAARLAAVCSGGRGGGGGSSGNSDPDLPAPRFGAVFSFPAQFSLTLNLLVSPLAGSCLAGGGGRL